MTDYSLCELILNGNKVLKRTVGEVEQEYEPTSAEEKQDRRNEMKARGTLLMALLNKDQLKFYSYKDSKLLIEAIEKRNKEEIETISLDDLYNNLKIYEPELTGSSNTSQNPQNVAFVSSNSTNSNRNNSINEADNTAYAVSAAHTQCNPTSRNNLSDAMICAFLASQPNSPQLAREDLEQIDPDDLEEINLQWEMAMLTIIARRFIKRTGRKLDVNGQIVGFERSKVECYNLETPTENALVAQDGIGGYDLSYQAEEEHPTNYALMAYTSLGSSYSSDSDVDSFSKSCVKVYATLKEQYDISVKFKTGLGYNAASSTTASPAVESFMNSSEMLENQENNKSKSDKGYHVVTPTFMDEIVKSKNMDVITIVTPSNGKKVESNHESADVKNNSDAVEPKTIRKNSFRPPVIEDWNSDDNSEVEFIPNVKDKTVRPSTEKINFVKSARKTIEKVIRPVWNNSSRVNHKNFANKMTHPHPNRRFVPQTVLTRFGKINTAGASVNTVVRPVKTAGSKTTGNLQQKEYKEKGVIDSGCSRHMTGNKCYLTEYKDYDGGFVSFRDGKGRIFRKVLLRVPRKDNIYSVDQKSVVPTKGLTCLFAKATIDEFNLWHRRLGHINFKNMNKLVRGNLVRGFASRFLKMTILVLLVRKESNKKPPFLQEIKLMVLQKLEIHCYRSDAIELEDERKFRYNAAGPSFTNDDPSSPANAARTSEEHLFEQFSPFKNAFSLPDVPKSEENKSQRLLELLIFLFSLSNGTQESDSSSERSNLDRSNARGDSTISTSEGLDTG
ncbi:ribonuclease H-like domain-containing protein [Tanacetum coccineum]